MVTIEATKTLKYKYFNRFSKFILIGNNIDGGTSIEFIEFRDFEDVKKRMKKIIEKADYWGEWDLKFYEVPDNYEIEILYGYYKVLKEGNLLFEMNYNYIGEIIKLHVDDSMIHTYNLSEYIYIEETEEELFYDVQVFEDFLTINLFDKRVMLIPETKKTYKEKYIMDDESYLDRRGAYNFELLGYDD
jgi:hypothetical protein